LDYLIGILNNKTKGHKSEKVTSLDVALIVQNGYKLSFKKERINIRIGVVQ
jgi:hypothetical protein